MISSVSNNGLRVEKIYPSPYQINVKTNDEIRITFNSDLDTATIINSFVVLKDKFMNFVDEGSLNRLQDFEVVNGNVSYKNKTIFFKPATDFDTSSRYVVCIRKNSITDITGNVMLLSFYASFIVSGSQSIPKCTFISPDTNSIYRECPIFEWNDMNVQSYVLQISRQPTFETLYCDQFILPYHVEDSTAISKYEPNFELSEGLYYARVKALCGEWSDTLQFFIKPSIDGNIQNQIDDISNDDANDNNLIGDLLSQIGDDFEVEVLDMYPKDGDVDIDTKLNCIYVKVRGQVTEDDVDFDLSSLEGVLYDADTVDVDKDTGTVDGSWIFVYNDIENATYIIFVIGSNKIIDTGVVAP